MSLFSVCFVFSADMWRFTVALLALAALAFASDVLELTDNDFANRIIEHDMALVEFFAPCCGSRVVVDEVTSGSFNDCFASF